MKKLFAIALIFLLSTAVRAHDLPTSFKQAAALGEAQQKERSLQAYIHLDLTPYYQKKYSPVFLACLKSTDHPDKSTFSFIAAIGKDGHVLRLYVDQETNIYMRAADAGKRRISTPANLSLLHAHHNEL